MYTYATSIDQAIEAIGEFRAGGTDIQERIRSRVTTSPLIDIAGIDGLSSVEVSDEGVSIGALMTLDELQGHEYLARHYSALVLPAKTLATPQARHVATLGGSLSQRTRCAYYRHPDLGCPKKGGTDECPSRQGEHELGVAYDFGPCVYPHPSSIGCALLTYDARLAISGRGLVSVEDFFGDGSDVRSDNTLLPGEIITAIHLPAAVADEKVAYFRHMSRAWAEWPLVEVVVRLNVKDNTVHDATVAIGAVANIPFRLTEVEQVLMSSPLSADSLARAAKASTTRCKPLRDTGYKVPIIEASVLEALELAVNSVGTLSGQTQEP